MNRALTLSVLSFLFSLSAILPVRARTIYVNRNAPGGAANDGRSWATAFLTVSEGLSSAGLGDEVWVAAATYAEPVSIPAGVGLYGGFSGTETERRQSRPAVNVTVLDGSRTSKDVVSCGAAGAVVQGFTIRGGVKGVSVTGSATIANNTLTGNQYGVSVDASPPTPDAPPASAVLTNNVIRLSLDSGVRIGAYATVTLTGNVVTGTNGDAVRVEGGKAALRNNTLACNGGSGLVFMGPDVAVTVENTILAFNSQYGVYLSNCNETNLKAFSHNDVFGNGLSDYWHMTDHTGVDGNIRVDPRLSPVYHNVHLQPDSPCIDAGDRSLVLPGETDIDGQPRIQGSSVDIGADESDGTFWALPFHRLYVSTTGNNAADGTSWATAKRSISAALGAEEIWVAKGTYYERVNLLDGVGLYGGFAGTETERGQRNAAANLTVVDGLNGENGVSCRAFDITVDGFTFLHVSYGMSVYRGSAVLSHNDLSAIPINGIRVGAATAVVTDSIFHGLSVDSGTAIVSRNSIIGGFEGVNVRDGRATITDNTISHAGTGILLHDSEATVARNTIQDGVLFGIEVLASKAVVADCLITGCASGGISVNSSDKPTYGDRASLTLTNSTITGNTGNGVYFDTAIVDMANNVIAFNGGHGVTEGLYNVVSRYAHNDSYGNENGDYYVYAPPTGQGNLAVDPLFADRAARDFHLLPGSPCIDTGDDTAVAPGDTDLDGKPRRLGPHVDMGAFESPAPGFFTPADAARCLKIAAGVAAGTPEDATRLGADAGAGLDLLDALRLARKVAGLEPNP